MAKHLPRETLEDCEQQLGCEYRCGRAGLAPELNNLYAANNDDGYIHGGRARKQRHAETIECLKF